MKDETILLCLLLVNRTVKVLIQHHYTMTSFPLNDLMDIYYVYFPSVLKNIFHPSIFGLRKFTWDTAIPRLRAQTSLISSIPPSPFQSRMSLFVTWHSSSDSSNNCESQSFVNFLLFDRRG